MFRPKLSLAQAALRDPKRWRKWLLEAMILAAIIGAVTVWQNRGLPEGMAPPLAEVRTDGSTVKVGAGGTAQLVVFWATWCPVCRAEEGNIESVARDWPVVSVAMQSGDREEVAKHLAARGLKVPAVEDDDGDISIAWGVKVVPAHFILDPAGNIRFRVVGYATTLGLRLRLWWAQQFPLA
ncbi:protein disulfide oxidoreductase [Rhodocyclaceae bacterium]